MLRLFKYLRAYFPHFAIAIVLLFIQAMADLALPDYMSRIVNDGIQQGGVEDAVPLAIRESQMDKVLLFMGEDDGNAVLDVYTLVTSESPDYDEALDTYPILADEPVFASPLRVHGRRGRASRPNGF